MIASRYWPLRTIFSSVSDTGIDKTLRAKCSDEALCLVGDQGVNAESGGATTADGRAETRPSGPTERLPEHESRQTPRRRRARRVQSQDEETPPGIVRVVRTRV